ncbi:MAG: magnesium/cobalt transporter CorA [Dehalococcoidales bacterium]|nr:magnesium/cobalt transporter CorA [Dehalococcoidales bacterium]
MAVNAYHITTETNVKLQTTQEAIKKALSQDKLLWIDIEGDEEQDIRLLSDVFGFHRLAIDDCLGERIHPPKIDEFKDYLFIILHGVNYAVKSEIVTTNQLELFIGKNYVVSHHTYPVLSMREVIMMVDEKRRAMKETPDFMAHEIADALIDNIMPTIDSMSDVIDDIEEEAIHNPKKTTIEEILKMKRSTMQLRRVITPQREVFNRLSRREFAIITEDAQIYFRDVYDHIVRIEDLNQGIRDRTDNALSTYLSSVANRQNETMKVLSIVAAIFLPLSLLAGIYGMNFEYMPELTWHWGYFAVLGFMAVAIIGITWWLWLKNVIGRHRITVIRPMKVETRKLLGHIDRITRQNNKENGKE